MNHVQKILIGIFSILFLIIIGELYFYLNYNQQATNTITKNAYSQNMAAINQPTPAYCGISSAVFITARNTDALIKKKAITSSVINNTYEGYISKIDKGSLKNPDIQNPNYQPKYAVYLNLSPNRTEKTFGFFFNDNELKSLNIKLATNISSQASTLDDLKVGNHISVQESFDMTKPVNGGQYVITVL